MKKEVKKTRNNQPTGYQLQVMKIVMEVWEQKMLEHKNWTICWPALFSDFKPIKGVVNIILATGKDFTDADIEKFKNRCIEVFGEKCNPASGKVKTRRGIKIRFLQWQEPSKDWPALPQREIGSSMDCAWYYEQIGKPWPTDILKFGCILIDGEEYRRIPTDGAEWMCASWDGILKIVDGIPYVPIWWNSIDGLDNMPVKVKIKKDIKGDDGTVIHEGETVKAVQGKHSCMEYDLTAPDGRNIKNVEYSNFEWLEHISV